ncbi:MAG: hypothetical protein ACOC0F_02750 [archaeon]
MTDELDRKEQTLQEYVGDSVREPVEEAVASGMSGIDDGDSRLGTVGSLVLGLVGIMLIVGGVLNGFAEEIAYVPVIFSNSTANLAVTVLLLFSGLAANLAGVAVTIAVEPKRAVSLLSGAPTVIPVGRSPPHSDCPLSPNPCRPPNG